MSKRKPNKRKSGKKKHPSGKRGLGKHKTNTPPPMDKMMSDLGKLLSAQEFESIEEINAFMQNNVVGMSLPDMPPETPIEEAQELIYQAWETDSSRQRVRLAKKALKISPSCVDAYVLLAEEDARTAKAAHDLYKRGVEEGEKLFGGEFEELVGHFWGMVETRPYMRALAGLASTLWHLGHYEGAIRHYQEMLRLNPNDNQGIRYILLTSLLSHGLPGEIPPLLERYEDDVSATWQYNHALYLFRQEGASKDANARLKAAVDYNPHVLDFLLDRKPIPREIAPYITFGGETEAIECAQETAHLWEQTPDAFAWLETFTK